MKVYVVDAHMLAGYDFSVERRIIEQGGHQLVIEQCRNEEEIIKKCADADAILDILTPMGPKSINALRRCKVLVRYGVGYDSVDVKAATAKGIKVCNVPHYCVPEVALHTVALILAACRNLLNCTMNIRAGKFGGSGNTLRTMRRQSRQTVGLIGFGYISRAVGKYLKSAGFSIAAYDPYLDDAVFTKANVRHMELDSLFSAADIISVHAPYTRETHHMINKEAFAKMKDGVILVNTARGPLVCEADLIHALRSGKVGAAGLDVFEKEPFSHRDHPFFRMDNVILTPHIAYKSVESTVELFMQTAQSAVAVLGGTDIPNIVNRRELGL